ncbi:hypothetical protein ES676_00995 [Bizionia saleffrena]|uniref:DinB family protein n=1 Tax=Bizionia saleffrena TaxID=291189 RepID=A0A8H2LJA4_9FLAO|nr:hypothetical protein [Bizionia saleffrena]TYB80277.1 hypothetical protein ES676_00995 [Bizionia saleffrena]
MKIITLLSILLSTVAFSQESDNELPYFQLPEAAKSFTAGTVAARQVDALGFRFYWASKDLNTIDLDYKPSDVSRTALKTIAHIFDLSRVLLNATMQEPQSKIETDSLSYQVLRSETLHNLKKASDILKESEDISQYKIIFEDHQYEFWNAINGPIADAVWHCGQLATFRRVTKNPISARVNHFTGTVKK